MILVCNVHPHFCRHKDDNVIYRHDIVIGLIIITVMSMFGCVTMSVPSTVCIHNIVTVNVNLRRA